jgi:Fe2+ transport system protein B
MEIERILAEADEEERQMKAFQMQQIKQSWADTLSQQKDHQDGLDARVDFDHGNCSAAAALRFNGEDTYRHDRLVAQKEQMRKWIQEQIVEKAQYKHLQKRDEMTYAEMIKAIDEIRLQTEEEEKNLRKYISASVKESNRGVSYSMLVFPIMFIFVFLLLATDGRCSKRKKSYL